MSKVALWTAVDWSANRCAYEDIGRPKNDADAPRDRADAPRDHTIDMSPAELAELKQAAIRVARDRYGSYDAFFHAYPSFHHKFLLSMVREPIKHGPGPLTVNLSWVSADRLSYRREGLEVDAADVPALMPPPPKR